METDLEPSKEGGHVYKSSLEGGMIHFLRCSSSYTLKNGEFVEAEKEV